MTDGVDGLILQDPNDAPMLAAQMRAVCEDSNLRVRLGERAAETANRYTWDENGRQFRELFARILHEKAKLRREAS
jgi:glycosyltransferase involved in cell wall biosynthesis